MVRVSSLRPVVGIEESVYMLLLQLVVGPYDIVQTTLGVSVYELRRSQETVAIGTLTFTTTLTKFSGMMLVATVMDRQQIN